MNPPAPVTTAERCVNSYPPSREDSAQESSLARQKDTAQVSNQVGGNAPKGTHGYPEQPGPKPRAATPMLLPRRSPSPARAREGTPLRIRPRNMLGPSCAMIPRHPLLVVPTGMHAERRQNAIQS